MRMANDSMKTVWLKLNPLVVALSWCFLAYRCTLKHPLFAFKERYQNDILLPLVIPHIRANREMILAQDNAPCHSACTTQQLLRAINVRLLDWPAKSLDLNPIEHVWDLLKRRVRQLRQHKTQAQLQHDVNQIWRQITQPTIQNYIRPMRQRCRAVIDANGGHTRY